MEHQTPAPPSRSKDWGKSEYDHCEQALSWQGLIEGDKTGTVTFKMGGLEVLMEKKGYETWQCIRDPKRARKVLGLCWTTMERNLRFRISNHSLLCLCRFEVTVTSVTLSPFMSHRGLVNTNQRLSLLLLTLRKLAPSYSYTIRNKTMSRIPNRQEPRQANRHRAGHAPQ